MNIKQLDDWAKRLGDAWVKLDVDAALSLVDRQNIEWSESPFAAPLTTWQSVYDVWQSDLSKQKDVSFSHEVLACDESRGVVRWQASLTRLATGEKVTMDGIFLVVLNDQDLCTNFMMWIETK